MKLIALLFFLAGVFTNTKSQVLNLKKNPNYKGEVEVSCQSIKLKTSSIKYPLILTDTSYQTLLESNYSIYKLKFSKNGTYFLYSLNDSSKIDFLVVTDGSLIPAFYSRKRPNADSLTIDLKTNLSYYLIFISTDTIERSFNFSFCSSGNIITPTIDGIVANESFKKHISLFNDQAIYWGGKKSTVYNISALKNANNFIKISINSDFSPIVYGLNEKDERVKINQKYPDNQSSVVVINRNDSVSKICVQAYYDGSEDQYDSTIKFVYDIKFEAYSYNPDQNWIGMLRLWFSDPLLSFVVASLFGILVGYFFFKKSEKKRNILYKELADSLIIDENSQDEKSIFITVEDSKLYKACLYKIKFFSSGELRIEGGNRIKQPLQVELINLYKIVDIKTIKIGNGWKGVNLISNNKIELDFDFIDPSDEIEITIIGQIDESYRNGGIKPKVAGRITEVFIKEDSNKMSTFFDSTFFGSSILGFVIFLPLFVADLFGLKMNHTFNLIFFWFFRISAFIYVSYLIFTANGRSAIKATWKMFKISLSKLKK